MKNLLIRYKGYTISTQGSTRIYISGPDAIGDQYFYSIEKAKEHLDFLLKYPFNAK